MNIYPLITKSDTLSVTEALVPMYDGVKLYTRIAVPAGKNRCPIVFIRTPYEKSHNGTPCDITLYENNEFIKHGYAVVLQHTRGRGDSEGVCIPFKNEREDGLCTLEYIRTLSFYDGEIYLTGGSYLATAHLSYISSKPCDIKGAVFDTQSDRIFLRYYRNGCCYDFCNYRWWSKMLQRSYPVQNTETALVRPFKDIAKRTFGEDVPEFTQMLMNDTYNEFWQNDSKNNAAQSIDFPVLLRDGWYDFYTAGMFDMWSRIPEETKKKSAFVVGPWGHGTSVSEQSAIPIKNGNIPDDHAAEWFDSIREGRPYKYAEYGKVNYHSMAGDKWKSAPYPTKNNDVIKLCFNADGTLSQENSVGEISYRYDPQKKNKLFRYGAVYEAALIGERDDVISFVSEAMTKDTDFFGNIRWHMEVKSSCDDSAFFIRIHFVRDGKAYNLTETITSLSHINPDYKRDMIQTLDIQTPPIGFTLKKGDRIRADISSNGSIYVPHSNLKCHWAKAPKTRIAVNTLYTNNGFIEIRLDK